jgi:hypothetical protein
MKLSSALLVFAIALSCKHNDGASIDKDEPPSKPKVKAPPSKSKVPADHRAAHQACPKTDTPAPTTVTYGPRLPTPKGTPCKTKSDCTAKPNGRCAEGNCTYDQCYEDKDCGKTVCQCTTDNINGYYCHGGNCAVDADCGEQGYCSPTFGIECGAFTGVVGFYCHTAKDECTDDSDCKGKEQGFCAFDPDKKLWRCGFGHCVG